jgi:hypothetical protein
MAELIQQYTALFQDENGDTYTVVARGARNAIGTWEGWLEFHRQTKRRQSGAPDARLLSRKRVRLSTGPRG